MPKFLTRGLSAILMLSLIFASLILPASAASSFSYRFNENPQMTSELRELALKHEMVPSEHTEVLVPIYYDYRYDWVDGCSWEQIRDMATETHSDYKYLVVKKTKGLVFYMTIWYEDVYFAENVLTGTRKFAAERLLDMKEGYKYNGEIYDVEDLYWFDHYGYGKGSYVAIVTNEGTFFEYYNRPWPSNPEQTVLVFTQAEFEEWYPEFMRPGVEGTRGKLGGGGGSGDFAAYLTANGFTPRYGEAQGVARRVLTFGGIGLVGLALVGGTTYAIIRKKRKKKTADLPAVEEVA